MGGKVPPPTVDVTPPKTDTEVDTDAPKLPEVEVKTDTEAPKTPEVKKTETEGTKTPEVKKTETEGTKTPEVKKTETEVTKTPEVKKTETEVTKTPEVKKTETEVTKTPEVKKTETEVTKTPEVKKTETEVTKTPEVKKTETEVKANESETKVEKESHTVSKDDPEIKKLENAQTTEQKETLKKTAPKSGDEMTPQELAQELTLVMKGKRRPSTMKGYVEEVELPNGHTWRKKESGAWCRFSIKGFCLLGMQTDPLIESLIKNDLQKSVSIADYLAQNPKGGTPENINHIIQSLETPQIKAQLAELEAQGFTLLYRGQGVNSLQDGGGIVSPVAREKMDGSTYDSVDDGLAHSEAFYKQLVQDEMMLRYNKKVSVEDVPHNIPPELLKEIHANLAEMTAFYNGVSTPHYAQPNFIDDRIGGTGIPTTRLTGIAANPEFAQAGGIIYIVKVPTDLVTKVPSNTRLHQEQEHVIFHEILKKHVYGILTPEGFPPGLKVDDIGAKPTDRLILAN
jgi:hypothetical protein